jgi:hypothetical protein
MIEVDFHGEALEPYQVALIEALGAVPVNYVKAVPGSRKLHYGCAVCKARDEVIKRLDEAKSSDADELREEALEWLAETEHHRGAFRS